AYRGLDEATDILSFSSGESFPSDEDDSLGDLVISLESMRENCQFFKVSEDEELTRLLVHGILHLLDWDHATNEDDEPMIKRQEEIVKSILKE
ncbi:MAG: rRNA maturation RNase YbeY, partial [Sphaerochaetaceae bacterium]